MKALFYDPYLDTLGGGERYVLTCALGLVKLGWKVRLFWTDPKILEKLGAQFGFDLSSIETTPDVKRGRGYDLVFWLSDGSIPYLMGKKNIVHFQSPFQGVGGRSFGNRVKFLKIDKVVVNSKFTKKFIDREYGINAHLLYPPVSVAKFRLNRKENLILYVGRFSDLQQSKRQDVLVRVFKRLVDSGITNWKLVIAGGAGIGRGEIADTLRKNAEGYPITIFENPKFEELVALYSKARLFWSASGFGIEEEKEPLKVEHFGITVVEAQAAGCVPLIVAKGGHREIVENGINGYLWESEEELLSLTKKLLTDDVLYKKLSQGAKENAQKFSDERFEREFISLL